MDDPSDISTVWELQLKQLTQSLREHGITRIESFAWRDLADPDAGGSEVHADHVMSRWAQVEIGRAHV